MNRDVASNLCLTVNEAIRLCLHRFELDLDPARAESSPGTKIVGYGEVSSVFALDALPGWVCKRIAGFHDVAKVGDYLAVVGRYIERLSAAGVKVVATFAVPVLVPSRPPVVYLLQPHLDGNGLGNAILRTADDRTLFACLDSVLSSCRQLLLSNREHVDGCVTTVDGQLSNWHFDLDDLSREPILIDVGTPFMRRHGVDEIDIGLFLAPAPPVIRQLYRRAHAVETYLDAFFDPRLLLIDMLGNFHKEGCANRIDTAVAHINQWLAKHGRDLGVTPITRVDVDRYYGKDAKLLELYLKARRFDRFVRTRILRRRYQFVLPGPIKR